MRPRKHLTAKTVDGPGPSRYTSIKVQGGSTIHVTICGAGAIGGYTGASLARAGRDVLFVDAAAAHVAAINQHGLTIEAPGTATAGWAVRVPAVTPRVKNLAQLLEPAGETKTTDIEDGRRAMAWENLDELVALASTVHA